MRIKISPALFGRTWICLLMIFVQSCEKNSSLHSGASLVKALPPEFSKEIKAELRDILASNDYPIANVLAVEFFFHGEEIRLRMRSIISANDIHSYKPKLINGDDVVSPQDDEIIVKHNDCVEIEQSFLVQKSSFMTSKMLSITNGRKENLLVSNVEMKYLQRSITVLKEPDKERLFFLPIGL